MCRPIRTQRGRVLAIQRRIVVWPTIGTGHRLRSYRRERQRTSAAIGSQLRQRKSQRCERTVLACMVSSPFFVVGGGPGIDRLTYCAWARSRRCNRYPKCRCRSNADVVLGHARCNAKRGSASKVQLTCFDFQKVGVVSVVGPLSTQSEGRTFRCQVPCRRRAGSVINLPSCHAESIYE